MHRIFGILAVLSLIIPGPTYAGPILINGSFELGPSFTNQDIDILSGSTQIVGWVATGTSTSGGAIDYLGQPWDVSDGVHAIDLDGRDAVAGGIQQTFATTLGQLYSSIA